MEQTVRQVLQLPGAFVGLPHEICHRFLQIRPFVLNDDGQLRIRLNEEVNGGDDKTAECEAEGRIGGGDAGMEMS